MVEEKRRVAIGAWSIVAVICLVVAVGSAPWWSGWFARPETSAGADSSDGEPAHAHDDDHAGHSEATSIELSEKGLKNIGFEPMTVKLGSFVKTVSMPAMVTERPGRSQIDITAPLTGVVTRIVPLQGAAVEPEGELFTMRLTHEELVDAQRQLIRTSEDLAVVKREVDRLEALGEGIVAGQRVLEQRYEQQRLEASLRAERQALLLHGLNEKQVDDILKRQELLRTITVRAPQQADHGEACDDQHVFHVQRLDVKIGQQVNVGATLAVLADHCELYVEGRAVEDDARLLRRVAREGWDISASLLTPGEESITIDGLKVLYLADHVQKESRVFLFYLSLPNSVELDQTVSGHRFVEWRFKPGQHLELHVPVEKWQQKIVLPVQAVVDEGAEEYVYRQNGDHFDRVPVHVEYRDRESVVVANDGAIFPGDVLAARGAYQMNLALKNQAGGGVDPHAGHSH